MSRVCSDFDGERLAARFASDAGPRKDGNRTVFADSRNPRRGKLRWRTRPIEAKLAREERERMRSKTRSIGMPVVVAILRSIAGQFDFRAVIRAMSQEIQDLLPHDHLDVALMNADQTMVIAYETGLHTEWDADTTASAAVAISPIRDLFLGRIDHIVTDDAQADPRFHFEGAFSMPIFAAGLRSRLHVPLKIEGRVIGALSFSTLERSTYCDGDIDNARIVADILSSYFFALQQSELARRTRDPAGRSGGARRGPAHRRPASDRGAGKRAPGDRHGSP